MAIPTKIEVFLTLNGIQTEITDQVAVSEGVSIEDRGRSSSLEDISPSILTFTLDNHDGTYTPGNPLSPWYPYFQEDAPVRVLVTLNGLPQTRFEGFITSISPTFTGGVSTLNRVVVTAADNLSRLARMSYGSFWSEELQLRGRDLLYSMDIWEFDSDPGATEYENIGLVLGETPGEGLYQAKITGLGNGGFTEQLEAEDTQFRSVLKLSSPATGLGPVVELKLQPRFTNSTQEIRLPFKLEAGYVPAPGDSLTLVQYWDTSGNDKVLLSVRVINLGGRPALGVYDGSGVQRSTFNLYREYGWNYLTSFQANTPEGTYFTVNEYEGGSGTAGVSALTADTIYVGGNGNPSSPGKTGRCVPNLYLGGVCVAQTGNLFRAYNAIDLGKNSNTGSVVLDYLTSFADTPVVFNGGDTRRLWFDKIVDDTALNKIQKYIGSIGGYFWVSPSGVSQVRFPGAVRLTSVAATLMLGEDDDASDPLVLVREVDGSPTRVKVNSPFGSVTVTDPGPRREATLESVCIDRTAAQALAYSVMRRSRAMRVARVSVDLATAQNSAITAAFWALKPTDRIRVKGFNAKILGYTEADYFVQGWSEYYTPFSAVFALFTEPANDPPTGEFDNTEYGRIGGVEMTVTGGTALSGNGLGVGTVTVTTDIGGDPLTVDPANYPLDLDWSGERVTVSTPPASAVSPQSVTLTARGVVPSVPRAHQNNDLIDVWTPAHFVL
jgi:hypothetical protein